MAKSKKDIQWDGPEVARVRTVRKEIAERFDSLEKLWKHWVALDKKYQKEDKKKIAKAKATTAN